MEAAAGGAVLQEIAFMHQQVRVLCVHVYVNFWFVPCLSMPAICSYQCTDPARPFTSFTHQVRDLLVRELFPSAEILGGLALARSRAHGPDSHAESLELYGDALMGLGERRRALVRGVWVRWWSWT